MTTPFDDPQAERDIPDETNHPERVVIETELQRVVHQALQKLSPEHRLVLTLYDLAGFTYEEIAETLGLPLGTVKSRLNRARLALRDQIGRQTELIG